MIDAIPHEKAELIVEFVREKINDEKFKKHIEPQKEHDHWAIPVLASILILGSLGLSLRLNKEC